MVAYKQYTWPYKYIKKPPKKKLLIMDKTPSTDITPIINWQEVNEGIFLHEHTPGHWIIQIYHTVNCIFNTKLEKCGKYTAIQQYNRYNQTI